MHTKRDRVELTICGESIVHIQSIPNEEGVAAFDAAASPWIRRRCDDADFRFRQTATVATIETTQLKIEMSLLEGTIVFKDAEGKMLLEEVSAGSRTYHPIASESLHEPLYSIGELFHLSVPTTLYGLGQHQSGLFNYNGSSVTLAQYNSDIDIPLAISGAGYGLLWNSAAKTVFNNQIPARLQITQSAGPGLDFYFLYGPEADQVIHLYRTLTGHVPMFPQWAYGLIQSKNRYKSQEELVHTVDEYRQRHIPLDTIVQDYYWWTARGSNEFNSEYPAIEKALQHIHQQHAHTMISIWPNLDMKTKLYQDMAARHLLIEGSNVYDATSIEARGLYWNELPRVLLAKGIDALWLDASEPEIGNGKEGIPTGIMVAAGSGALEANAFPFFHTKGVSQHWHQEEDDKRVFLLTRSAFLGQQANGASIWSGDINSTFDSLRRQVPAGLNLMLSGIPYWTTDIGGYSYPDGDPEDPRYRELFIRWFEYGTFCPLFRIHGRRIGNKNELWSYGDALPILLKFDKLRYALLPYIYSLAYRVTNDDYTIMRPLVMDSRKDPKVSVIGDSFMFGPALLVSPVMQEGAIDRDVYLPGATAWYDFWTGEKSLGGRTVHTSAPLDRIPVYVRAGSIVPFGPDIEYVGEKVDAPMELRIYSGADGSFDLYSDQGDGYGYEHGAEAVIPITWNETTKTLTIGSRMGKFSGMRERQAFRIIWVRPNHGAGSEDTARADETVQYMGRCVTVVHP